MLWAKLSKYNFFVDYNGKKLLFNGLTGKGFCMTLEEHKRLIYFFENLELFKNNFPNDFERLKKLGFIVDKSFDELAYIKFRNKQKVFDNTHYHLIINPTMECNFRCWYCYEEHSKSQMSQATVRLIKKHIKYKIEVEKIHSLTIGWFGGEPLLYFNEVVYPISLYAKNLCKKHNIRYNANMTTNAYFVNEDMVQKFQKINLFDYQITLDGDKERHNKIRKGINGELSYNTIVNNIRLICCNLNQAHVSLRINYDSLTFKQKDIFNILEEFPKNIRSKITLNTQRVWQTQVENEEKENSFLPEFIKLARKKGYSLHRGGSLNIKTFYSCYASRLNYANINHDGKVYKCTARKYTTDNYLGELNKYGEITWKQDMVCKMYSSLPIENDECLQCKYLPLCYGQCIQHFIEQGFKCRWGINREKYFTEEIKGFYSNQLLNKL